MPDPWMQTYSGRAFPLIDPEFDAVDWPDIIYGLAHINRFSGHAGTYSVAQHSCIVADQLPAEWKPYGLLHDAHEAYIGDITTPTKSAIKVWHGGQSIGRLARSIDRAIYMAAGLLYPIPDTIAEAVHIADRRAIITERRDLMKKSFHSWGEEYEKLLPLPERIVRWSPQQSIARFTLALCAAGLDVSFSFCQT